ncbi:MAG: type III secretion system stator protein SctL [Persicimonas sp.]
MTETTEQTGETAADEEPELRVIRAPDVVADRVERLFDANSATRVVSARVVDSIEEANLQLERASREAERMLEEARREAERLREEARTEGHEEGLAEVVELMAQARKEYSALIEGAEDDMLQLAARLAERIVGEALELDPSRIQRIVADVLRHARGKQQITVHVAPADREALDSATGELAQVVDGVAVHLESDPELGRGSCVIQTETGRIDGRIETQLDTLLRAIKGG